MALSLNVSDIAKQASSIPKSTTSTEVDKLVSKTLGTTYQGSGTLSIPRYSADLSDCPGVKFKDMFGSAHMPKYNYDGPDWKLSNLGALSKIGGSFSAPDFPSFGKVKMDWLKTNGMFDSFKCANINKLDPIKKKLSYKQELKSLNSINCNSISAKGNYNVNKLTFNSLALALNCSKPPDQATKDTVTDLQDIVGDDTMSDLDKLGISSSFIDANIGTKFSLAEAKASITDDSLLSKFKTGFSKVNDPGSKMKVLEASKKASVSDKESLVGYSTNFAPMSSLAGDNDITKLANKASKDNAMSADINNPIKAITGSQKLSLFDKAKSLTKTNKYMDMLSRVA